MKVEKHFAALAVCLVVLWASRFAPYSCEAARETVPLLKIVGAGVLLTAFMYMLAYDAVALLTFWLGWEGSFDHLRVYPGDPPAPNAQPVSLKTKLLVFYPLELTAVVFFLLPLWMEVAYCG